jgi:hypothetical protein
MELDLRVVEPGDESLIERFPILEYELIIARPDKPNIAAQKEDYPEYFSHHI